MASADATIRIAAHDNTQKAFTSVNNNLTRTNNAFKNFRGTLMRVAGVVGFGALAKATLESADRIQKLSIRLGVSTEALSEYQHVAELSGVDFNALVMSWQKMTKNLGDAATGTGEAKDALALLKLEAKDLNKLSIDRMFEELADAISAIEDPTVKAQVAMDLFGTRGIEVIQMMEDGAEGMRDLRKVAIALGISLSRDAADKAAKFNDQMHNLKTSLRGLMLQVMPILIPTVEGLAKALTGVMKATAKAGVEIGILVKALVAAFIASKLTGVVWILVKAFRAFKIATIAATAATLRLNAAMAKNVVGLAVLVGVTAWEWTKAQEDATDAVKSHEDAIKDLDTETKKMAIDLKSAIGWEEKWWSINSLNKDEITSLGEELETTRSQINANREAVGKMTIAELANWTEVKNSRNWLDKEYASLKIVEQGLKDQIAELRSGTQYQEDQTVAITETDAALLAYKNQLSDLMFEEHMQGIKLSELEKQYNSGFISVNAYKKGLEALGVSTEHLVSQFETSFKSMSTSLDTAWVGFWENTFLNSFTNTKVNAIKQFANTVKRILIKMMAEVAANWVKNKVFKILFNMLFPGAGGIFGKIFGKIFSFFGFQRGGDFTVGGEGGKDKNLVAFKASKGESVSVKTPEQQRAGDALVLEIRAMREDLARVVAGPIVGAVTRGQFAAAGGMRH